MIPNCVRPDTPSQAEFDVFRDLEAALDDEFVVFHSMPWLSSDQRGFQEGECDFLVLHPRYGLLSIEAKSGQVRYDGRLQQWFRGKTKITDPFQQASKSKFHLNGVLSDGVPGWRNANPPYGHAVSFPHADHVPGARPDMNAKIVLLREDHKRLQSRVPEILAGFNAPIEGLAPKVMDEAVDRLAPQFQLVANLSGDLDDEYESLCRMTAQQIAFMSSNLDQRRVLVEGCAGSGKTMLALESAARLQRAGARVLMLCYNIPLSEWLAELAGERGIQADVFHFHALCRRVVESGGLEFNEPPDGAQGDAVQDFWDNEAPSLMDQALADYEDRYDAILVDEGQDFCWHWWGPIEHLLRDLDSSHLSIFYDPRQDLWGRTEGDRPEFPIKSEPFRLSVNCRNTRSIAGMLGELMDVPDTEFSGQPEGVPPEEIRVDGEAGEREAVRKLLHRLVQEDRVDPSRIVIVGTRRFENSVLADSPQIGAVKVVARERDPGPGEVRYATVYRFKGLEDDCVILLGFADPKTADDEERKRLYVAASRARLRLFLVIRRD
jgi:hypothetical protein